MTRIRLPFRPILALVLSSMVCGASPQEGRVPRPRPTPPRDTFGPVTGPAFQPEGRVNRPGPNPITRGRDGFYPEGRVSRPRPGVTYYPGTRTILPPRVWARCTVRPNPWYWENRDFTAYLKWMARSGFIPVTPIGIGVSQLTDYAQYPAGWRAYGIAVPAGGRVQFELKHEKLGWFRLMLVNRWGEVGPGMLRAAIAPWPVMVTYTNPGKEATSVYLIVDDPGWWSSESDPYTLAIRRDWDPLQVDLSRVPMVSGLWGASPSVSAEFRGPSLTGPAVFPH